MMVSRREETFSPEETSQRRDEVVRRMANTPPQPKIIPRPKTKKKAGEGRGAGKHPARREP